MKFKDKKIKVIYRKLGKERLWGAAHVDFIELDTRLKGKKHMEIFTHEAFHYLFPELSEKEIVKKSILFTNTMWNDGYRKCDHDETIPLQDLE